MYGAAALTCAGERFRYGELLCRGENREVRNTQTLTTVGHLEAMLHASPLQ